jgi:hypothetical protein
MASLNEMTDPHRPQITSVSSGEFNANPQRYLDQVAGGTMLEITDIGVVLMPRRDLDGYETTVELLSNQANAAYLTQAGLDSGNLAIVPRHRHEK